MRRRADRCDGAQACRFLQEEVEKVRSGSLAKYRELLRDGASWWESCGKGVKSETATRESLPSGRFSVGVEGIEPSASTV
jgi:hypothetical protein